MEVIIESPVKVYLNNLTNGEYDAIEEFLKYTNTSKLHQYKKLMSQKWFKEKHPYAWQEALNKVKNYKGSVLFEEEHGKPYIRLGSVPYLIDAGLIRRQDIINNIVYPTPKPVEWFKKPKHDLYPYQRQMVDILKNSEFKIGTAQSCTGCHAKGTEILMFDGTLKKVEDIVVGDQLMGPDSLPRNVLHLFNGREEMFEIKPLKGESFVVNKNHILSLQATNSGDRGAKYGEKGKNPIKNVSVQEYLNWSAHKKHIYKLYRTGVEFKPKTLNFKIPPYILGLWLGDGHSGSCGLTTMDESIKNDWCDFIKTLNLNILCRKQENNKATAYFGLVKDKKPAGNYSKKTPKPRSKNEFNAILDDLNLRNNKHIPFEYLTASREDRLSLLAGLIDTDGGLDSNCFSITQKNNVLTKDIIYLARSLGFGVTVKKTRKKCQTGAIGEYNRIGINGDLSVVPTKLERKKAQPRKQIKNVLRTQFKVVSVGDGEYFGFELDKDHLYLLSDFTVTHNSGKTLAIQTLTQELGLKTLVMVPSQSIFAELLESTKALFGKDMVGGFGDGKKDLKKHITIAISKSITNIEEGSEQWSKVQENQVLIGDEAHSVAAETLDAACNGVLGNIPYRFFFTGTHTRGDGTKKLLESITGKPLFNFSTAEAIKGGFVLDHDFTIVRVKNPSPYFDSSDGLEIKRELFLRNPYIAAFIVKLIKSCYTLKNEKTLVMVDELGQVATLVEALKKENIPFLYAHSGKSKKDLLQIGLEPVDNKEQIEKFNKGEAAVLIGTKAISVGVNIYCAHRTVNWQGGSSETATRQSSVGRSVRKLAGSGYEQYHPPKNKCTIFDFDVEGSLELSRALDKRIEYYQMSEVPIKKIVF